MYFGTFSERARRAVFFGHHFAKQEAYKAIEPKHLLRGLLQEDPQLFALANPHDSDVVEKLRKAVCPDTRPPELQSGRDFLPLSRLSVKIIESANAERGHFKQSETGTDHLLLAILNSGGKRSGWLPSREDSAVSIRNTLAAHGVTAEGIVRLMQSGQTTPQTRESKAGESVPEADAEQIVRACEKRS